MIIEASPDLVLENLKERPLMMKSSKMTLLFWPCCKVFVSATCCPQIFLASSTQKTVFWVLLRTEGFITAPKPTPITLEGNNCVLP
jgi:hypothetical protein